MTGFLRKDLLLFCLKLLSRILQLPTLIKRFISHIYYIYKYHYFVNCILLAIVFCQERALEARQIIAVTLRIPFLRRDRCLILPQPLSTSSRLNWTMALALMFCRGSRLHWFVDARRQQLSNTHNHAISGLQFRIKNHIQVLIGYWISYGILYG